VEFIHQQIRAARIMLERWDRDPLAARLLRRRLGMCWWNLAYAEQCRGYYRKARSAYWSSARHAWAAQPSAMSLFLNWKNRGTTPSISEAVARGAFMSLPKTVLRMVTQGRGHSAPS